MKHRGWTGTVLAAIGFAAGCAEVVTQPVPDKTVTGRYVAIEFTLKLADSSSVDLLENGATVDLTLAPDSTTSGSFSAFPGAPPVDMAGRWNRKADIITLDQPEATIIREMQFLVVPGELHGEANIGQFTFRLILHRQPGTRGAGPQAFSSIQLRAVTVDRRLGRRTEAPRSTP